MTASAAVLTKCQDAWTQGTRGTHIPTSILPFPDHLPRTDQGFYTSKAQGHLWIKAKHSTALVWERLCTLWTQGASNRGNCSHHGCFTQSWHQVGMFLFTPHHEVQEKSNPTTFISPSGQIVFNELERSKSTPGALSYSLSRQQPQCLHLVLPTWGSSPMQNTLRTHILQH